MPKEYKIYHANEEATERRWQQLSYEASYLQAVFVCCPAHPRYVFFEHHTEADVIMTFVCSIVYSAFQRVLLKRCGGAGCGWQNGTPACLGYHSHSPLWKEASFTHRCLLVIS